MDASRTRFRVLAVGCLVGYAVSTMGCNLFGRLDPPHSTQDAYAAAIAAGNDGRCQDAANLLAAIPVPNDDVYAALGWAYLCIASATAANVAKSLYSYTSSASNFKVVGTLADSLLPTSAGQTTAIANALTAFSGINDPNRKGINTAIGNFVSAAQILANQGSLAGDAPVQTRDVSPAGCAASAANCAAAGGICVAGPTGMSNSDVLAFINAITAASTSLSTTNASDLQSLATGLKSNLPATPDIARCFIFNNMIP